MKRVWILLSILVVTLVAGLLFWKNQNSTGAIDINILKLKNPENVNRIFISPNDPKAGFVILEKTNLNQWTVKNGSKQYDADSHYVNRILFWLMQKIEVKNPISDRSVENVSRDIVSGGNKVIFYEGKKEVKTLYIGGSTPDGGGTFMHLPGEDRPFITRIPGFNGTSAIYFSNNIEDWRSSMLINLDVPQIASLSVKWFEDPSQGFSIVQKNGEPNLFDAANNPVSGRKNSMLAYMDMFKNLSRVSGDMPGINRMKNLRDSILRSKPFWQVNIKSTEGKTTVLNLYRRPVSDETYSLEDKIGQLKRFETDTYWGVVEGSNEIWEMQDIVMRNRMKKLSDFQ